MAFSGVDFFRSLVMFGGEDPVLGNPWHHEEISRVAAQQAGFVDAAADEVAWHADYVDSYLYNPVWWAAGGVPRLKASLAGAPMLRNLHFDDLFAPAQVLTMWRRYTSGTLAGLVWAWQRGDVAAARHLVGASLHALEDFYSHSNWVDDPARRSTTFLAMPVAQRESQPLWTGSYEVPDHLGIKPHGKPAPFCALLEPVRDVMEIVCHTASPLLDSGLCQTWRACQDATLARPPVVLGIPVPQNIWYLAPAGIALDSTWQADIGVQVRGLSDITGRALFETAAELARDTAAQWLQLLGDRMASIGAGSFWQEVKDEAPVGGEREDQFEDFSKFPYMFLGAGSYPPPADEEPEQWYLRVRLTTAAESGAGTDADVIAHAGGRQDVLDYMPRDHPLLAYNDFESGDDQVYYLGPYDTLPASLELENRAADAGDVLRELGKSFVRAVQSAIDRVADVLFQLIGKPPDLVGNAKQTWGPQQLQALPDGVDEGFTIGVDGGDEGRYTIHGFLRRVGRTTIGGRGWSDYLVRLDTLVCEEESKVDRISFRDEPFVFALLVNQAASDVQRMSAGPYKKVNSGDSREMRHEFTAVRVPDDYGYLTLPVQVFESDGESGRDRDRALEEFATGIEAGADEERRAFLATLGAAVAADWKLARAEVFAFTRGHTVTAGVVYAADVDQWVKGEQRALLPLALTQPVRVEGVTTAVSPSVGGLDVFALGSDTVLRHIRQSPTPSGWGSWSEVGGQVITDPVIAQLPGGRLQAFGIGTDHALWHNTTTGPWGGWTGWVSLGGWIDRLAVGYIADGCLEVFARGSDAALHHIWEASPGGAWNAWESLGGAITDLSVAHNPQGGIEVFAIGTDHSLWRRWQTTARGDWNEWVSLGGWIDRLAVGYIADGRLEVFARGSDAALHHTWQTSPGSTTWNAWAPLGGAITDLSVAHNPQGGIEVFAIGTDHSLWRRWQTTARGDWNEWVSLGGWIDQLSATANSDGRLEVFARGNDAALYHTWQTSPGGEWSGWTGLGGQIQQLAGVTPTPR